MAPSDSNWRNPGGEGGINREPTVPAADQAGTQQCNPNSKPPGLLSSISRRGFLGFFGKAILVLTGLAGGLVGFVPAVHAVTCDFGLNFISYPNCEISCMGLCDPSLSCCDPNPHGSVLCCAYCPSDCGVTARAVAVCSLGSGYCCGQYC